MHANRPTHWRLAKEPMPNGISSAKEPMPKSLSFSLSFFLSLFLSFSLSLSLSLSLSRSLALALSLPPSLPPPLPTIHLPLSSILHPEGRECNDPFMYPRRDYRNVCPWISDGRTVAYKGYGLASAPSEILQDIQYSVIPVFKYLRLDCRCVCPCE